MIDINTKIGHYPFRPLAFDTAGALVKQMDEYGIEKAFVSSIQAIFYADTQNGNLELAEEVKPFTDRLIPLAIINPEYPGWEKDFDTCIHSLGMKGIELFPGYHNYTFKSTNLAKLIGMAAEAGIPVFLPGRLIDIRGRHWMDTPENLSSEDYFDIISLNSDANFILSNTNTLEAFRKLKPLIQNRKGRVLFDFSRLEVFSNNPSMLQMIAEAGAGNLVFASCMPFQYPDVQQVKLFYAGLSPEQVQQITEGNIRSVVKI